MLKDTMSHAGLSIYTEIATILLVVLFAGALLYLFWWRPKASWKHMEELPLERDEGASPQAASHLSGASRAKGSV
jgi:hypothetical protein